MRRATARRQPRSGRSRPRRSRSSQSCDTGPKGDFTLHAIPAGVPISLTVYAAGFLEARQDVGAGEEHVVLLLGGGPTVSGRVLDANGQGLAGISVMIRSGGDDTASGGPREGEIVTSRGGAFELRGLLPGSALVVASADEDPRRFERKQLTISPDG